MKNIIIALTSCFLLLGFTGCMSMPQVPKIDLSALKSPGPVTSVIAAWEPAVSNGDNPMRGFGGRIYFYDQEMIRPVKIDGTVIVYVFNEEGRVPGNSKPDEGFVFDSKTLNSKGVYKKSSLGHSYNLWIPLDAAGPDGQAQKISLIVRYIPKPGKPGASVVSQQATAYLPGKRDQGAVIGHGDGQGELADFQLTAARSSLERPVPRRSRLTEERVIESNANRSPTLQAVTIR